MTRLMLTRLSAITPRPTQRLIPVSPLYRLRPSPCRRLTTLMRPSQPVRHFWPLRNQRFFCSRLRSGLLVERLGMQTRFTPLALAAHPLHPQPRPVAPARPHPVGDLRGGGFRLTRHPAGGLQYSAVSLRQLRALWSTFGAGRRRALRRPPFDAAAAIAQLGAGRP